MSYRKPSSKPPPPPPGAYFFQALLRGTGRTCGSRALPAFSNNKKMVPILHRELERKVEKVKHMHEVGGHAAEDQKQYEFPA